MTDTPTIPPVVYLPLRADSTAEKPAVVLLEVADGRRVLPVYTALDRLSDACGDQQAWLLLRTEQLGPLKREQPYDVLLVDQRIPEHLIADGRLG